MTNINERLRAAAAQNNQLLRTIRETGYSVAAYQQSKNYISSLKRGIALQEEKLSEIIQTTEKEYNDHKNYRDSHLRRLAFKLSGKKDAFSDQATKEEKEWLDAVAMQLAAKNGLERLNAMLSDATKESADLKDVCHVHNRTVVELEALYNSIFKGPTPSMPAEDAKEDQVVAAEREFNVIQLILSNDIQAGRILGEAHQFLQRALADIEEARSHSSLDAWGVGGTWVQMAEQSALSRCQQHVSQTEMLMSQALRLQPAIQFLGNMEVAQMNFMSDILFDNIFSDLDMRNRIIRSIVQLSQAELQLRQQIVYQNTRVSKVTLELDQAHANLVKGREELQVIRREAFERLAEDPEDEFEAPLGPPPSFFDAKCSV